jgi:glucosamine kinase
MEPTSLMPLPPALLDGSRGSRASHVLGVDGGATKTLAAVLDLDSYDVSIGTAGPSNADAVGLEAATAAMLEASREALEGADVSADAVGAAVFALAGSVTPLAEPALERVFGDHLWVVNDVVAAWAVGTGTAPGVAAISGTGSHVFGVDAAGRSWRTGGWGHVLGDEGSGYWIGLEAVKAALKARDGSGPATGLMTRAAEWFDVAAIELLPEGFYAKEPSKADVAAFTLAVAEEARAGDEVARAIFQRAGSDLATQTLAVVRALGLEWSPFTVGLVGSVWESGELIRTAYEADVEAAAPQATFVAPELPPAAGALLLAARANGTWDELVRERFDEAVSAAASAAA